MTPQETLVRFFNRIWGENEGFVYLPTRSSSQFWDPRFFEWPKDRPHIIRYIFKSVAEQKEVYFAPSLYHTPRPGKENVKGAQVLWADFDGDDGVPPTPAPTDWSKLAADVTEPSLRVQTSSPGNQHVYWLLDKFTEDKLWLELKNRSIAYTINSDTACWNADRLLRPPETINFGYSKPARLGKKFDVGLEEYSDREYGAESFGHLKYIRELVQTSLTINDRLPIEQVMMKCKWTEELSELFTRPIDQFTKDFWWSRGLVNMAHQAAELGWTDEQIYTIICHADDRWNKYRDRDDCEMQRSNIVEKVRRKHPYVGENPFQTLVKSMTSAVQLSDKVAYSYKEFMELEIHLNFILDDLLAEAGYGFIFGESGIGKTQLAIQMMRCICTGRDFIGYKNVDKKPRKVLFFSLEMGPKPLRLFLDRMKKALTPEESELIGENLTILPIGESMSLDVDEGKAFFQNLLSEFKPAVVFIDSLATLTMTSLNEDKPAREMLKYIQQIRNAYGCSVIVLHHSRKSDMKRDITLDDFYGNTFITTGTDFVAGVTYHEDDKDIIRWTECKLRLGSRRDPTIILRNGNLTFTSFKDQPDAVLDTIDRGPSSFRMPNGFGV